ncbi:MULTISPECIES: hypothetical protein [Thermoanaerobacterium]|uniref:Uncharacterized protein n=2 Tax=Thermoanaerobacterium TaxID=28895 RepID=W9E9E8_9THEO|nr:MULTISPECIES: hypothetical protein [Thermoanaerobacterium]AFK85044.1 hypothetical protein Tsac_0006 [Thermoanaerobacterium saccharolyticum JW/SL-YS485]ETO37470.1 hypothetical protein V518_2313 [Thermoanaerobacterium aotearoense SCUT27]
MKKSIYSIGFVVAITAVSIIFMLDVFIKEQPPPNEVLKPAIRSTYYSSTDKISKNEMQVPVFNTTPNLKENENKSAVENEKSDKENSEKKNSEENDIRKFDEKSLDKLIQERNREFTKINGNNNSKESSENLNLNRIVVTPEKILSVQREMDFATKSKAIGILMKLGPSGIGEIMKMSQDGVTEKESYEMMDILKKHLSEGDIDFLKSIVEKYFDEKNTSK